MKTPNSSPNRRFLTGATALRLSLIVNLVLSGLVAWAYMARGHRPKSEDVLQHLTNRVLRSRKVVVEAAPRKLTVNAPFHWSDLESADYRVYMANLRSIGCPERTVRDIIMADVDQLFFQRARELLLPVNERIWWLLAHEDDIKEDTDGIEEQWKLLMQERETVFEELLGHANPYGVDEQETEANERERWAQTLDFLSPEMQEQVLTVRKACEAAIRELWAADHELTKEERQQRQQQKRALEANRDQQLAALLTPEEWTEYQLRTSEGANMRQRLAWAEFSEDEIRTIAHLSNERRQMEAQFAGDNEEARQRRKEVAQQSDAQLQEALGGARYADYQRASDSRFGQVSQVVERYGLPGETAVSAYNMQREAEARVAQVRSDGAIPTEERQVLQQAIRDEAERSLKAALGEKAFTTLQRRGGAGWLEALAKPSR